MSLTQKSISGSIWTLIDIVFNKAIYFIATLILARILGPVEFGLIGMIMVFFTIGTTLVDSGLSVSLIRTINPSLIDYSTIFYMNLGMSIFAYFLVFFIAPFVALFYSQPILESLIRIYCIGFIFTALRMIPQAILVKEMKFKKVAILNIPGNIIGLGVGIVMAVNGFKVWSVVGLYLTTQLIATLFYWFFIDWKPSFIFSRESMSRHWVFGYKLMLSAQLNTIFDNIYNILIGKFYSIQSLGFYERAYTINNYPISVLSGIINKVSLPLLSGIVDDDIRVHIVYKKILTVSFYISSTLMLLSLVLAKPIFLLFLGEKWLLAVPFFQILCLAYMLYPVHSLNINLLSVLGRSDLFLKIEIQKKLIIVISVLVGFRFGILGLVWSNVLTSVVALFINMFYSGRFINYNTKSQILDLLPILMIVGFASILTFWFNDFFKFNSYLFQILITGSFGIILIVILSETFRLKPYFEIKDIIKQYK